MSMPASNPALTDRLLTLLSGPASLSPMKSSLLSSRPKGGLCEQAIALTATFTLARMPL